MLLRGQARWCKVTGKPVDGYEAKFKQWELDVTVDEASEKMLVDNGLGHKIKTDKNGIKFIKFTRKEFKQDGSPNQPIRIVDHRNEVLQDGNPLNPVEYKGPKIGNGSIVNINFQTFEYAKGKFSPVILSMQIWDLIPYEGEFPTRDDSEGNWEEDAA